MKKVIFNEVSVNTIRSLAIEAINRAQSGHMGIALGAAPIMYVLFNHFLNVDVDDPHYFNRDRFVLSAGHGSALLYATMLVSGYKSISIDDLKNFRQLNSHTPGHPERSLLAGVDVGTGPLGQGVAAAVGLAMAEAHLSASYSIKNNQPVVDHYTYCLLGDGDLEEGVCQEALSLAGRYCLKKLVFLYDSNDVQLDGAVSDSTKIQINHLCKAYGLNYIYVDNGSSCQNIYKALADAKKSNQPTLIEFKTVIGFASDWAGTNKIHGSLLSEQQIKNLYHNLTYDYDKWTIPSSVRDDFALLRKRGKEHHREFDLRVKELFASKGPNVASFSRMLQNEVEIDFDWFKVDEFDSKSQASRELCGVVFNKIAQHNQHILVLNNDLSSSTKVIVKNQPCFDINAYQYQNINMGVREFASAAIALGVEAHGGCKCVTATFLSFSDYMKPAIRLAAINELAPTFIFSHDSITVGQDGPTHQPIEQLTMLRTIPNTMVFRPCNLSEMVFAFLWAFTNRSTPTVIITSRAAFLQCKSLPEQIQQFACEIVVNPEAKLTIAATGSEVGIGLEVIDILRNQFQLSARLVSINCLNGFCQQPNAFQKQILGELPLFVIEFGSGTIWKQFTPYVFGIETFGKSASAEQLLNFFQLTPQAIAEKIAKKVI